MSFIQTILNFFYNDGTGGALIGATLTVLGSHFSSFDFGMRRNTPLRNEPKLKQLGYVFGGILAGAVFFKGFPDANDIIYVSVGAGWLFILKSLIALSQTIGAALEKINLILES